MANTYTQIHIQTVFAVRDRRSLINPNWKDKLYGYITGIIQNHDHKLLQMNGMPDHIHILIGFRPTQALSNLIKLVKQESTKWINSNGYADKKFSWQSVFGTFSYSNTDVPNVIRYIQNQEIHHRKISFHDEYRQFLNDFDVEYDERFIFKPILW